MELKKTLKDINKNRHEVEACFVFSCWADPDLFEDYKDVNVGKDTTLKDEDAIFYWQLGMAMHQQNIQKIDAITIEAFLANKDEMRKRYERYGGYQTVEGLRSTMDPENADGYYDQINRMNALSLFANKTEELFTDVDRFNNSTDDEIYDMFDLLGNSIAVNSTRGVEVEDLTITDNFIKSCIDKEEMGLPYKSLPLLNYTTLGLPLGDIWLLASHSGVGKSSMIFENIALYLSSVNEPVVIFSNEMDSNAYKHLLLIHILTKDLNYWKLTRKKLKQGEFTDEDLVMLDKAKEISEEKYANIRFVKMFNNNTSILMRFIKKYARQGYRCFIWDTFKSDDISDGNKEEWLQLLKNSRKVFNLISKLHVSMVMTFQLALYTTNQRYLDASCLAGSKQIKEVVSELIMLRPLWSDERSGEKNDCKVYHWDTEKKEKEMIQLDPDKKYLVAFVNKTRNGEGDKQIVIQWDAHFNTFKEIGYATIKNDHRMY